MFPIGVRASIGALALPLAVFGCSRRHDGGAPAGTARQLEDPSLRALQGDAASSLRTQPTANEVTSTAPDAGPPPASKLRGFRCTRPLLAGKAPQGPLTLHFAPISATDFTIHLEFHCQFNCRPSWGTCDYSADLRAEHGVLRDAFPGIPVRCTQSPEELLAVDCGFFIGSDVETVVKARSISRLVRFTLPPNFDQGIPDQPPSDTSYGCLPFVNYERTDGSPTRKSINLNYLQFSPEACELDP
jgi:hypothetical protein